MGQRAGSAGAPHGRQPRAVPEHPHRGAAGVRARPGAGLASEGPPGELLTTREARSIEPGFSPSLLGAMYSPLRSQADPPKATRAFAALAQRAGARVLTHHEVTAIAPRSTRGYVVRTSTGELECE